MIRHFSKNRYEEAIFIVKNVYLWLCIVGIFGNILSVVIFCRKFLKSYSYSFYCRLMAVNDTILLVNFSAHLIKDFIDTNFDIVSPLFCSLKVYPNYVIGTISLWLLTLISIDRLFTIVYPSRFNIIKKRWFQITMISVIISYSIIINLTAALNYKYDVIFDMDRNLTKSVCYLSSVDQNKQSMVLFANFLIVNIVVNNILNVKIIAFIVRSRRKTSYNKVNRTNNNSHLSSKDRKFSICSVGLNLTSFISRIPIPISVMLSNYFKFEPDQFILALNIGLTIATLDHSSIFFINMLFNTSFRREFLIMLGIKSEDSRSISNQSAHRCSSFALRNHKDSKASIKTQNVDQSSNVN